MGGLQRQSVPTGVPECGSTGGGGRLGESGGITGVRGISLGSRPMGFSFLTGAHGGQTRTEHPVLRLTCPLGGSLGLSEGGISRHNSERWVSAAPMLSQPALASEETSLLPVDKRPREDASLPGGGRLRRGGRVQARGWSAGRVRRWPPGLGARTPGRPGLRPACLWLGGPSPDSGGTAQGPGSCSLTTRCPSTPPSACVTQSPLRGRPRPRRPNVTVCTASTFPGAGHGRSRSQTVSRPLELFTFRLRVSEPHLLRL